MQKDNIWPDPEKMQYIIDCIPMEEMLDKPPVFVAYEGEQLSLFLGGRGRWLK